MSTYEVMYNEINVWFYNMDEEESHILSQFLVKFNQLDEFYKIDTQYIMNGYGCICGGVNCKYSKEYGYLMMVEGDRGSCRMAFGFPIKDEKLALLLTLLHFLKHDQDKFTYIVQNMENNYFDVWQKYKASNGW